jgi:hypothetical protein
MRHHKLFHDLATISLLYRNKDTAEAMVAWWLVFTEQIDLLLD